MAAPKLKKTSGLPTSEDYKDLPNEKLAEMIQNTFKVEELVEALNMDPMVYAQFQGSPQGAGGESPSTSRSSRNKSTSSSRSRSSPSGARAPKRKSPSPYKTPPSAVAFLKKFDIKKCRKGSKERYSIASLEKVLIKMGYRERVVTYSKYPASARRTNLCRLVADLQKGWRAGSPPRSPKSKSSSSRGLADLFKSPSQRSSSLRRAEKAKKKAAKKAKLEKKAQEAAAEAKRLAKIAKEAAAKAAKAAKSGSPSSSGGYSSSLPDATPSKSSSKPKAAAAPKKKSPPKKAAGGRKKGSPSPSKIAAAKAKIRNAGSVEEIKGPALKELAKSIGAVYSNKNVGEIRANIRAVLSRY